MPGRKGPVSELFEQVKDAYRRKLEALGWQRVPRVTRSGAREWNWRDPAGRLWLEEDALTWLAVYEGANAKEEGHDDA